SNWATAAAARGADSAQPALKVLEQIELKRRNYDPRQTSASGAARATVLLLHCLFARRFFKRAFTTASGHSDRGIGVRKGDRRGGKARLSADAPGPPN